MRKEFPHGRRGSALQLKVTAAAIASDALARTQPKQGRLVEAARNFLLLLVAF